MILLIATQAFSKWIVLVQFRWNQDYIAATLCENKAKPKLACKGTCQLTKKMAAEEKETTPSTNHTFELKFEDTLFTVPPSALFMTEEESTKSFYSINRSGKIVFPLCDVFHPPLI